MLSIVALLALALAEAPSAPHRQTVASGGIPRTYEVYAPSSVQGPTPLLILLHGSGGKSSHMLSHWKALADREGIVLVAPDASDNRWWRIRADGPAFFRDLVEAVSRQHAIDPRRMYLFGHSGGAVYALTLSLLESEFFAAVAIHGGAWRTPREYRALPLARRRIPVALFMGSRDEYFPLRSAFDTRAALEKAGHPALLKVIPRHRHAYYEAAPQVNEEAWQFLEGVALNADPVYQSYETGSPDTGEKQSEP